LLVAEPNPRPIALLSATRRTSGIDSRTGSQWVRANALWRRDAEMVCACGSSIPNVPCFVFLSTIPPRRLGYAALLCNALVLADTPTTALIVKAYAICHERCRDAGILRNVSFAIHARHTCGSVWREAVAMLCTASTAHRRTASPLNEFSLCWSAHPRRRHHTLHSGRSPRSPPCVSAPSTKRVTSSTNVADCRRTRMWTAAKRRRGVGAGQGG